MNKQFGIKILKEQLGMQKVEIQEKTIRECNDKRNYGNKGRGSQFERFNQTFYSFTRRNFKIARYMSSVQLTLVYTRGQKVLDSNFLTPALYYTISFQKKKTSK